MAGTIKDAWEEGVTRRAGLVTRCELYAAFTIPSVCPPVGYDQQATELQTDYQAVGAQAVNNLANKINLALFAPSRPFMRYDVPAELAEKLEQDIPDLKGKLALAERESIRLLDQLAARPRLYAAAQHLIVTGNCLLILGKDKGDPPRVLGLKKYTVKRSLSGKVVDIMVKDDLKFDELEADVQAFLKSKDANYAKMDPEDPRSCGDVCWFTRVHLMPTGKYRVECYIDDHLLPQKYNGEYTAEELPYRALTWELPDGQHYGVGLVEQCAGDFAALSALSESALKAAILASEFRWLVNPAGQTQPEDLEESENGAAIPGVAGDIEAISAAGAGVAQGLQIINTVLTEYVNRIGRTFLLGSSVIRDAERVTAEEVRLQAQELETSLGGVYSRLAIDFQLPLAYWLAGQLGVKLAGSGLRPTIITGLDALSRNADLENLKACIGDMAQLADLSQGPLGTILNFTAIAEDIFAGRGVDKSKYVNDPSTQQQLRDEQTQRNVTEAAAPGVAKAAVEQANQPQG
ncbi:phage tail protein [Bordetella genomosp. 9]|uniref:Phage tail protein n=1 Tax=Bordetella genomosp. 9 TaxID=1416803 RepID=A0A261R4W1_9BORD|nr:portal protein [Bordetella genomosp. 9]OZI20059.1 phage tail protein [Bordetella genomosp. 9]